MCTKNSRTGYNANNIGRCKALLNPDIRGTLNINAIRKDDLNSMSEKAEELSEIISKKLAQNRDVLSHDFFKKNPLTNTKFFILDDVLPESIVHEIYRNFPDMDSFFYKNTFREKKLVFAKVDQLPNPLLADIIDSFQTDGVISETARITGISDIEGDPSLYAGGISRMDLSHFLNPHIDNSHDGDRTRYRRLNLLFYVTPNLAEGDGGNLELWNDDLTTPLKIPAKFNRLVVIETHKTSWHSVDAVTSDLSRCCVSNYFFSESSPTGKDYYHVTSFLGRPEQPVRRIYGRMDNFLRQSVATLLGVTRGKRLSR